MRGEQFDPCCEKRVIGYDEDLTLLDGQDNWTGQTYNASNRCGVTATLSHDGTQSLQFQEVGPGYGCDASRINDGNWLFPAFGGSETNAAFQVDMRVKWRTTSTSETSGRPGRSSVTRERSM